MVKRYSKVKSVKGNPKRKTGKDGKGNDSKERLEKTAKEKEKLKHVFSSLIQKKVARTQDAEARRKEMLRLWKYEAFGR